MLSTTKLRFKKKLQPKIRILFRGILFFALIAYTYTTWTKHAMAPAALTSSRQLLQNGNKSDCLDPLVEELSKPGRIPEAFTAEQLRAGWVVLYVFGTLYMFLALSIVCDEVFCPALDAATEAMNISPDVAGATLMAAGGSAPELATSFIGTFYDSDVGFGTIVGSAVFNVLFVIGMCVLYSSTILELTWWPLFRDCTVYALGLLVLAVFFTQSTPNQIDWWEALILILLYVGYVILMKNNHTLKKIFVKEDVKKDDSVKEENEGEEKEDGEGLTIDLPPTSNKGQKSLCLPTGDKRRRRSQIKAHRHTVLELMSGDKLSISVEETAIRGIRGNCDTTFDSIDTDKNGSIDHSEFKQLMRDCEGSPTENEINEVIQKLDTNNDGKITKKEFRTWYKDSEKRVLKNAEDSFRQFSIKRKGDKVEKRNIKDVLGKIDQCDYIDTSEIVKEALNKMDDVDGFITKAVFDAYFKEHHLQITKKSASDALRECEEDSEGLSIKWPDKRRAQMMYIFMLPLVGPLYFTCPNVQKAKWKNFWPFSFFMAIVWVAVYSIFMVQWATVLGITIMIPPKVMGLIFLAAGTSIPDLLTSVCVAMKGNGDMAVSSSIGSNIFDILVGLPLPWLVKSLVDGGKPIIVGSPEDNVGLSVFILFTVVLIVICTIWGVGWKMSKNLAYVFFAFYGLYVGQELIRYYGFGPGSNPAC